MTFSTLRLELVVESRTCRILVVYELQLLVFIKSHCIPVFYKENLDIDYRWGPLSNSKYNMEKPAKLKGVNLSLGWEIPGHLTLCIKHCMYTTSRRSQGGREMWRFSGEKRGRMQRFRYAPFPCSVSVKKHSRNSMYTCNYAYSYGSQTCSVSFCNKFCDTYTH